jgi:dTDP-4-dehydrorhamnose reductase
LKVPGRITPVTSAEVVTPAKRPQFCALSNDKLSKYGMVMPVWQDALTRHLVARDVRIPQRMAS